MAEKSALNNLNKHKWERSRQKLTKILRKDSASAGAHYVLARYFFAADNPAYNIDSAYANTTTALQLYQYTPARVRDRLKKLPLDSTVLTRLRGRIDSAAFARARQANTEAAYLYFIARFAGAEQQAEALHLRDEAAYQAALASNTYEAYSEFLNKYPRSHRAAEATKRYDRLLFEEKTRDNRLKSFEAFLSKYPQSPYRREAEVQVFERATAGGTVASFREFLRKYPGGGGSRKAENILYYLLAQETGPAATGTSLPFTDSLQAIHRLNQHYLVPYFEDGRFGFMNDEGREVIKPFADAIDPAYLCGNIQEDILVVGDRILARDGSVVYSGQIDELDDLGAGFMTVTTGACQRVIHKSGFYVGEPCVEDARLLHGRYIATRSGDQWSVYSLAGKLLVASLSDVKEVNEAIAMKHRGRWSLVLPDYPGRMADGPLASLPDDLEDVKAWPGRNIWIKKGGKEGVLGAGLNVLVPPDDQVLEPVYFGVRATSASGIKLYNTNARVSSAVFADVRVSRPWVSVKTDSGWRLLDMGINSFLSEPYDSVSFKGIFAVGHRGDSLQVHFSHAQFLNFTGVKLEFLSGKDSSSFLLAVDGDQRTVYDARGTKLFTIACDRLEYAEGGVFILVKKEKKGLVNRDGDILLKPEYDAIGEMEKQWVPLLKKMKFGLFSIQQKKEIRPAYDKNLKWYNDRWLVALRNGAYGLIGPENEQGLPFEYDEIRYWNDSAAFVKKGARWMLLDVVHEKVIMAGVRDYRLVCDTKDEKVAIVRGEDGYGVFSSVRGTIIPGTFTDIVNIGPAGKPLYFTEKHVKEAAIFVVIYYDGNGNLLRRQAIDANDYDRIYCSN